MIEEFISRQARIITTAIDVISDSGLSSLSFQAISMRINISEDMLYKYYQNVDEILVDVVNAYFKFDKMLFSTIMSKDTPYLDKLHMYVDQFADYYGNYFSLSALSLHYEELLHNVNTRDIIVQKYSDRREFLKTIFEGCLENNEIAVVAPAEVLADNVLGIMMICMLNRRIMNRKHTPKDELKAYLNEWIDALKR